MPSDPGRKIMSELSLIAGLPEVKSAVRGDLRGALLDAAREPDAENVAAVMGFLTSTLVQGGDQLGLGALSRVVVTGEKNSNLLLVQGDSVISACVTSPASVATVEKALDAALHGRR
jgi:hypothetical protein